MDGKAGLYLNQGGQRVSGLKVLATLCLMMPFAAVSARNLELLFIGEDGKPVPHAVVSLAGAKQVNANSAEAVIDQRDRRFEPHVTVVARGAQVSFPNSDDTRHHVYSFSPGNSFELKLYRANDAPPVTFERPGVVTLGCNIHDTMKAYVLVSDEPVAGVSDASGNVSVPLGAGQLPLEATVWHPQLKDQLQLSLDSPEPGEVQEVRLPMSWRDPQRAKSDAELEALLRQFAPNAD